MSQRINRPLYEEGKAILDRPPSPQSLPPRLTSLSVQYFYKESATICELEAINTSKVLVPLWYDGEV